MKKCKLHPQTRRMLLKLREQFTLQRLESERSAADYAAGRMYHFAFRRAIAADVLGGVISNINLELSP